MHLASILGSQFRRTPLGAGRDTGNECCSPDGQMRIKLSQKQPQLAIRLTRSNHCTYRENILLYLSPTPMTQQCLLFIAWKLSMLVWLSYFPKVQIYASNSKNTYIDDHTSLKISTPYKSTIEDIVWGMTWKTNGGLFTWKCLCSAFRACLP